VSPSVETEFWQQTFDSIGEGIVVVSEDRRIINVNGAIADIVGCDPQSLLGKKCYEAISKKSQPCPGCPFQPTEQIGRRKNHCEPESKEYVVSAHPIKDAGGHIKGHVLWFRDVSEEKHIQQYLSRSNRLVALGELVAGVAHNFGNILMGVSATLELLYMRAAVEPRFSDLAETILGAQEQVSLGAEVIQRLLTLAHGTPFIISALDPKTVAENAVALCVTHPLAKRVRIVNEIPEGAPPLKADMGQLEEAIVNLLLNALHASDGGTIRIGLRDDGGDFGEIWISDEGCGIAAEDIGKLFDPFFSKRKDGSAGTGLGLPCSLAQVNRMGGTISVESELGNGSVFKISLPKWLGEKALSKAA
jgi:PAS domain S-box-containing protein